MPRGVLVTAGHDVTIAKDGREALTAQTQGTCDLLFMDMQMPIMRGLDAMQAIRSREPERGGYAPSIAVTAPSALLPEIDCVMAITAAWRRAKRTA